MNARYSRQVILPEIGAAGQARLAAAKVLVVGAGGLGCPALQYLAGAGVGAKAPESDIAAGRGGMIGIIDPDTVDISNLHRQTLYNTGDAGQPKAALAKNRLLQLNPDITVHAYAESLTDANALRLF